MVVLDQLSRIASDSQGVEHGERLVLQFSTFRKAVADLGRKSGDLFVQRFPVVFDDLAADDRPGVSTC